MQRSLIEHRHPVFGALLQAWEAGHADEARLEPLLGARTVRLRRGGESEATWIVTASGALVDRLFGRPLCGADAGALTTNPDDVASEAEVVWETGRMLMVEEQLRLASGECRIARLYLPIIGADGRCAEVLCGIATID